SCLFVPLLAQGQALGVLSLVTTGSGRRLERTDLARAEEVGRRAGVALNNARLYLAAMQARQAREDLLAVVSHDLRNPLSSILTSAGMLDRLALDERGQTLVRTISRSAERMDRLINDLLDSAQIQAGALAVRLQAVDSSSLIRDAVEILKPLA